MITITINNTFDFLNRSECDAAIALALGVEDFPIVFDCADCFGMGSGLLEYILRVRRRAALVGGVVEIINADDLAQETLELVGWSCLSKVT